ncbi:hypothetical protein HPB51_001141 [Rhipicephalus microplus]|uniref:Tc1-like transposase DDE domain-containing protein n=1 Tax=Rhipicephalus microplus TaxID=6941 RepID=A0A9J6EVJ7_RHIMP|nr:hypothetical protein HPB51_001141 [Rhipicephalus microplus]
MRFPEKSVREVLSVVSEDTGISPRTVAKLKAERLRGPLVSPKKRAREVKISSSRTVKHDSLTIHAIRLKVHSMYAKREIPTLDSVIRAVNEDDELPNFTKTTLWRLMKDIGFTFAKRKRNLALIERSDIIAWRRRYLWAIKKFRGQGSVALEEAPTKSTRKADIQLWLTKKGVPWSEDMVRAELLELSRKVNTPSIVSRIDTLAATHGHEVLRVPPYHCEFNPIELVWSQVKGYIAARNTGFTLAEVEKLLPEALASVKQEKWQNCCAHVEQVEAEASERDIIVHSEIEPLVFCICDSCNSSSDESGAQFTDDKLSGIEELC